MLKRLFVLHQGIINGAYMSIWLILKAAVLAALILVTIPFALCLVLALWGKSFVLVVEKDSWLAKVRQPLIRGMVMRFLA